MIRVSGYQLFASMVIFQLGSTVIFGFASDAGRDAWIAVLLSTCLGLFIILGYTMLSKMMPGLTLVEWFPKQFGPWLGFPIAWTYPLLFIYDASRGISDLEQLIPLTLLPNTPTWVILICLMLASSYILFSGVEVILRLAGLLLPIVYFLFILEIVLLFGSKNVDFSNLQPMLGEGWSRVWETVWPFGILQTFGETIEFAMVWTLLNKPEQLKRVNILAGLVSGMTIALFQMLAVMVLGEGVYQRNIYPLLMLLKQVSISDFLDNLDALGVICFMITVILKFTLHLMAAVLCIQKLTYSSNRTIPIIIISVISTWMGSNMANNVTDHIYAGVKVLPYNLWIHLFLIIPGFLLLVTWIRNKRVTL